MTYPPRNPPAPADIGAVVVTHHSAPTIDECLSRLRAAAGVAAIRVVDNRSGDDTIEVVARHACADPRVRFVANPDNPGFAVACNQGAAALAAEVPGCRWLAFVNPDAMVQADTLERLRALADGPGECLLGADLVGEDGVRDPAARRNHLDFGALFGGGGRGALEVAADDRLALQPVAAVSGALMFLPRALFTRIGGFDEGYRLHAEDLDLCRRAGAAGATVAVANAVRVLHVRGVSSRARPLFVEWHKHRGLWRYFRKFEAGRRGLPARLAVWLAIWLHFPLAAVRQRLRN